MKTQNKKTELIQLEKLIVKNLKGWANDEIMLILTEDPKITGDPSGVSLKGELQKKLTNAYELTKSKRPNDFNGEKVSVKCISINDKGQIEIIAKRTDYFTLWGIPNAAPDVLEKSNHELIYSQKTELPCGLYTANIVITLDKMVIMNVISAGGGFGAGRLSFGFEEQTEVEDNNPIETSVRGMKEEIGIDVSEDKVRLLGLGKSLDIAYVAAYCIINTGMSSKDLIRAKNKAIDQQESAHTLIVPISEVDKLVRSEVPSSEIEKYLIGGKIKGVDNLLHHRANFLRWELVKKHLELLGMI